MCKGWQVGMVLEDGQPYVVPVGYAYSEGKIFFHTCNKGLKMDCMKRNSNVCFEADETLSDNSMFKSVIVFGTAEIVIDKAKMIPYLQKLIDKYRDPGIIKLVLLEKTLSCWFLFFGSPVLN